MWGVKLTFVNYWGRKYAHEKDVFWRDADIFVFPTLNEAFGLVLLEAMEYAIPCVGTNEGGINDIIDNGQTGFITQKGDVHALATAIEKLIIDSSLCETMGQAGRLKFLKKYTENTFERTMLECLKNVIAN